MVVVVLVPVDVASASDMLDDRSSATSLNLTVIRSQRLADPINRWESITILARGKIKVPTDQAESLRRVVYAVLPLISGNPSVVGSNSSVTVSERISIGSDPCCSRNGSRDVRIWIVRPISAGSLYGSGDDEADEEKDEKEKGSGRRGRNWVEAIGSLASVVSFVLPLPGRTVNDRGWLRCGALLPQHLGVVLAKTRYKTRRSMLGLISPTMVSPSLDELFRWC